MNEAIVTHVEQGETLSEIAVRYDVSVDALQRWNGIENPDLLLVGQRIVVYPAADSPEPDVATVSWEVWLGGALVLAFLLLRLRRKRRRATPAPRAPSPYRPQRRSVASASRAPSPYQPQQQRSATPAFHPPLLSPPQRRKAAGQQGAIQRASFDAEAVPTQQANGGERFVGSELMRCYREWILINDVLLPTSSGTTQIDHILVSPTAVFLIETKEMNGWVFGSPGQEQWTQSFAAGRWSRKVGIKSWQFKFYNPLRQNEGHARALVKLGIVDRWRLRPVVTFVGGAQLKTAEKFLPFDEHENIANENSTWRMRGVVCMGISALHRYIEFSVNASSSPGWTRRQMEMIRDKIRANEIPVTAESLAKHVHFVKSVKEMNSR
ncbi:MAG: NERD domain-containing protein [Gammaproteobacteria bacterium]|nr:NERD domain-containing protein [Gammaproteobacteria bacterium]